VGAPKVAGLDIGTTKIQMVIYDESLAPLESYIVRNETMVSGDIAEQDPLQLMSKISGLLKKAENNGVKIVGLASYRGSLIVWDRQGRPLSNIITWMDSRASSKYGILPLKARIASKTPVLGAAFTPESMAVRLAVLLVEKPRLGVLLSRGKALAWNVDAYIAYRLSGRYIADASTSALTGLVNPSNLKPLGIVEKILGLPRLEYPIMPFQDEVELNYGGQVIGSLLGDQQSASIALDCLEEGCLKVSIGTGFFLDYSLGETRRTGIRLSGGLVPIILLYTRSKRVNGVEGYLTGMGKTVEWFVENMFGGLYSKMDESITDRKPPLVVPYIWGSRTPRLSRGSSGILGLEPGYTASDIANGIAHGVAAALGYAFNVITSNYGRPKRLLVTGGLSRLNRFVKLVASYMNTPVHVPLRNDLTALGAAYMALRSTGSPVKPFINMKTIEPDPSLRIIQPEDLVSAARSIEGRTAGKR